ncbi:MAG: GH39 family glycosyl hydrolase [Solirubrobacteraceae bacterium]
MLKRLLPLALMLASLAVPAAAGATIYGAEVGAAFTSQARGVWSADQVMSSLQSLRAAGGRVGRADSDWAGAEPRRPVRGYRAYDWSYDDLIAAELAQAGLRWQPDLAFAPRWAEAHRSRVIRVANGTFVAFLPPAHNGDFAAYASAFMRRYGRGGAFWHAHRALPYLPVTTLEVWNEPDNKHDWGNDIDLQDYARMYEAVRTAIHHVDRRAQVVSGGLAWTMSSLPRLLKAFIHKPLDAVAFHPYAATPTGTVALGRYAIAQMRRFGRAHTPLLANEYGWTSLPDTWGSTRPRNVSRYSYEALVGLSGLHLAYILPFQWADPSWGLSDGTYSRALHDLLRHG